MKTWVRIFALALLPISCPAMSGGGPQNVALVVNAESWASLTLANEYIQLRGIPFNNVIYLGKVPNFETIDIATFRDKILSPVLKILDDRKLTPQIDYLVYSSDIPYAVDTSPETKDLKLPQVFTRTASITGLTFLHERVMAKDPSYLRLDINRYMRWVLRPETEQMNAAEREKFAEASKLIGGKDKKFDEALVLFDALGKAHPKDQNIQYNLACCLARVKKFDEAMAALKAAIDAGWFDLYHIREDEDLVGLRERADFKALIKKLEVVFVTPQPTLGFRASDAWNEKCEIAPDGKGDHYLLSTMLAVTSGRGTSVNEALNYLRAAANADGTAPSGTIYYMLNGDIRSKTRRWGFTSAVEQLKNLGVKAEIATGNLPARKTDVLGTMAGIADFDWAASGSTILPGAICEHLTSCGGELAQHRSQTPCSQFLRFGAAGTSGAVQEPYALQQKFPTPFIHVFYAQGCSLAEAFYQSVSGPYQLIVVGDPLCAPWKHAPVVTLDGIKTGETMKGRLSLKPGAATRPEVGSFELFVDGLRHSGVKPGEAFSLDTTAYCDGWHELTLVGISKDRIATQGRMAYSATFDNHGRSAIATFTSDKSPKLNQSLTFSLRMKDAESIALLANGREVGRVSGDAGELVIPAKVLGLGPVTFQGRGYAKELIAASSEPIAATIEPVWLAAQEKDAAATKRGLRVEFGDGAVKIVEPARDSKWLAKAGLTQGRQCKVDAWFEASADDLHQFQLQTPMQVTLTVDGQKQPILPSTAWQFIPLALRKGMHHLQMTVASENASSPLELRFGASGTRSVEAAQFLCVDGTK